MSSNGMSMICVYVEFKGLGVIIKWILISLYRSYKCKNSENNLLKIDEIYFNGMKIVSEMLGNYNLGIIFDNK